MLLEQGVGEGVVKDIYIYMQDLDLLTLWKIDCKDTRFYHFINITVENGSPYPLFSPSSHQMKMILGNLN